ncbi:hypothetical protein ACSSS7_001385 [Eimeria intestinalis]
MCLAVVGKHVSCVCISYEGLLHTEPHAATAATTAAIRAPAAAIAAGAPPAAAIAAGAAIGGGAPAAAATTAAPITASAAVATEPAPAVPAAPGPAAAAAAAAAVAAGGGVWHGMQDKEIEKADACILKGARLLVACGEAPTDVAYDRLIAALRQHGQLLFSFFSLY